ncbi:murein hydrolase activator EnvC [Seminibacterium arietis]|uniref:Murein hydrolase activator EnvC n=1 Tax=Seminibacterium arietis TaxID=1173502 RepID=A0ABW3I8C3_9PAST
MLLFHKLKKIKFLTALFLYVSVSFLAYANELSELQNRIKQQEQKIVEKRQEQKKLQDTLQNQENRISQVIGKLNETKSNLTEINKHISATERQTKQLRKQKIAQKNKLAKQLELIRRLDFNPSLLEKLFSQDAQKVQRMKAYYQHLNQTRLALINELNVTENNLVNSQERIREQKKIQQDQLEDQESQQKALQRVQKERQLTLERINQNLSLEQDKLNTLKANEDTLLKRIAKAEQLAREQEKNEREVFANKKKQSQQHEQSIHRSKVEGKGEIVSKKGLGYPKKQYAYPVVGKILNGFGSTQIGEIKWKGIVISAKAGSPVKAIANGRVILSSWLRGYGHMVIIKHGNDDLSLYGYNQAVSVKEGQLVKAGQKIAEVGMSGGQQQSNLYFEIRRKGIAVNPIGWLR